jgi:hypothetical protein
MVWAACLQRDPAQDLLHASSEHLACIYTQAQAQAQRSMHETALDTGPAVHQMMQLNKDSDAPHDSSRHTDNQTTILHHRTKHSDQKCPQPCNLMSLAHAHTPCTGPQRQRITGGSQAVAQTPVLPALLRTDQVTVLLTWLVA